MLPASLTLHSPRVAMQCRFRLKFSFSFKPTAFQTLLKAFRQVSGCLTGPSLKCQVTAMQVTRLDFAPEHAYSYNELIEVVKLNLLLADWNDEDHNESLLSVRNSKWGKEMLRNVR